MDIPYLNIGWTKGYQGSSIQFINETTICYKINNIIKFISIDGSEKNFQVPGNGVGPICTNPFKELFAYAENSILPTIFIHLYSDFSSLIELKDGAKLEYNCITFSSSLYLASLSGVPDFQMIIWRYTDGTKLITHDLGSFIPIQLLFNPADWRLIAAYSQKQIHVYTIEQSNTLYIIRESIVNIMPEKFLKWETKKMKIADVDIGSDFHHEYNEVETRFNFIKSDLSSVCGLVKDDLHNFEEYLDKTTRLIPISICWTLGGSLLVGCEDGQLFKIDLNTSTLRKLQVDILYKKSQDNEETKEIVIETGSVDFMRLHKNGVYMAGKKGLVYLISFSNHEKRLSIVDYKDLEDEIVTIDFNPSHKNFVIGTKEGLIYLFSSNDLANPTYLLSNYSSRIISLKAMGLKNIACVTLKESGHLQMWDITGKNISTIFMNLHEKALTMATSPVCSIAVVGMDNGMFYIVNLLPQPIIVHSIRLHRGPILAIRITSQGQFIITGSNDGKILITDGFATFKFATIGSINFDGTIRAITSQNFLDYSACAVLSYNSPKQELTQLSYFMLPFALKDDPKGFYQNRKLEINKDSINFSYFFISDVCIDLAIDFYHNMFILANTKNLYHYNIDISKKQEYKNVSCKHSSVKIKKKNENDQIIIPFGSNVSGKYSKKMPKEKNDEEMFNLDKSYESLTLQELGSGNNIVVTSHESGIMQTVYSRDLENFFFPTNIALNRTDGSSRLKFFVDKLDSMYNIISDAISKPIEIDSLTDMNMAAGSSIMDTHEGHLAEDIMPLSIHEGHKLLGGCIQLSNHQIWLITGGGDGRITIRFSNNMKVMSSFVAHNFWSNGVKMFDLSPDCQTLFSTGHEGLLYCFKWDNKYMPTDVLDSSMRHYNKEFQYIEMRMVTENKVLIQLKPINIIPLPEPENKDETEDILAIEEAIAANEIYMEPPIVPPVDATWSELKEVEALKEEQKKYIPNKLSLRTSLKAMRKKLKNMIAENEAAPDIEKLGINEFDLDIEKQIQLQNEADKEIEKLRDEKELANISKMFLANIIKKECWDQMDVKGRAISNFKGDLDVYNYPLIKRPKDVLEEINKLETLRKIEMADSKLQKENIDYISMDEASYEESVDSLDMASEKGSMSASLSVNNIKGANDYMYSQFELDTRDQKYVQILLLKDSIYKLMENFNRKFTEVFDQKDILISKVCEKNVRIRKIMMEIGKDYKSIVDPVMGTKERPEILLVTKDEEVKVERYLTAEQQERLAEERAAEEERIRREMKDDWRGRGLNQMMGGVLELRREDELKRDIPVPHFMNEKTVDQYNDEERRLFEEYKKQVKELEEEREKFKKVLEGELSKLQEQVGEILNSFDSIHMNLFKSKIDTESDICQLKLMILRLRYSMLLEEQMKSREIELKAQLEQAKYSAHHSMYMTGQAITALEDFKAENEMHIAEDKLHEKSFRKEFSDQANFIIEMMFKFYKKRPRALKGHLPYTSTFNSESENPYSERPSTALQDEDNSNSLILAMAELDDYVNIPEGIDRSVWIRMTRYRQEKVQKEIQLKQEALTLSEMQSFVIKRREEEEASKLVIDNLIQSLQKLRAEKHLFYGNLEVQICLKQGQVEVDAMKDEFVINHQNSILLHKDVILELNKKIKALGKTKIESMIENSDFKKGIRQLEWDYKKMEMEMEDLKSQIKDVAAFKVTREVQRFLTEKNYNESKNIEIQTVEKSILVHSAYHKHEISCKQKQLDEIKKNIRKLVEKNASLMTQLERLNIAVLEKKHMQGFGEKAKIGSTSENRYNDLMKRKRMMNIVKAQADEIQILRAEVDRLRMRTFPALRRLE